MPSIYQAKCRECDKFPPKYRLGEIIEEQRLIPDHGVAFDDPKKGILFVSHPGEESSLRAMGAHSLNADGRVLAWQALVCSDCGAVSEQFRVGQRQAGCLLGFVLAVGSGVLLNQYIGVVMCCVTSFVGLLLWINLSDWFHRRKWRERDAALALKACPACGSSALVALSRIRSDPMPCAHCHKQSMVFEPCGIS
jgi:hypothetical protein